MHAEPLRLLEEICLPEFPTLLWTCCLSCMSRDGLSAEFNTPGAEFNSNMYQPPHKSIYGSLYPPPTNTPPTTPVWRDVQYVRVQLEHALPPVGSHWEVFQIRLPRQNNEKCDTFDFMAYNATPQGDMDARADFSVIGWANRDSVRLHRVWAVPSFSCFYFDKE